jgi:L-serine deaminase
VRQAADQGQQEAVAGVGAVVGVVVAVVVGVDVDVASSVQHCCCKRNASNHIANVQGTKTAMNTDTKIELFLEVKIVCCARLVVIS